MCIGEACLDSIGEHERATLRCAAGRDFPRHVFGVETNADGLVWVVLEPPAPGDAVHRADRLRFTICRIAPCLVVMSEDAAGRRQICSAADPHGAMAFARSIAGIVASPTHPAHEVMQ